MSFLNAEWRKLILVNYEVDPSILTDYLPVGTALELWKGKCLVSLVGFMFVNTKILGFKIPGHVNFEEVNLRFYVKRKTGNKYKRGVVFIKELVPKHALTLIANSVYKEHYKTVPMCHNWSENEQHQSVEYGWKIGDKWQSIAVEAAKKSMPILSDTEEEFITEHYWGYTKINSKKSFEYEVTHPKWDQYEITSSRINVDFEKTYGRNFSLLNEIKPKSIILAEGSAITVENKNKISTVNKELNQY